MNANKPIALLSALALTVLATGALADSTMNDTFEEAIAAGAQRMMADDIAERLTGKTVTYELSSNGDRYLVYYGLGNETTSRKVDGDKVMTGFHAVTDNNQVCIGWDGRDLPRLRCLDVLLIDGVMHKYAPDGSLSGRIIEFADGNVT